MICPTCQTSNEASANFCFNCGTAMIQTCPNCAASIPLASRFCSNCGRAIGLGEEQQVERLLPPEAASERAGEGERRVVTVLFADIKGSTAMAEQLDPEEWAELMNGAFDRLISPIYRYEGTVARLLGDALLAFFGAPVSHEDDPQRAVRAGLEIVAGVQAYHEQMQRERGLNFAVRVGINTGLVVVGAAGSEQRVEYTVMGDAVNLAARMEQTAALNTVQISAATHRLIAPLFDTEPLGSQAVKGRLAPVESYRLIGPKAQPGLLRGIAGLGAPLIGRATEMDQLGRALDELRAGRGQIVSLIGDAGLGKSRIIRELKAAWGDDGPDGRPHWSESRGRAYDSMRPFGQIQQQIRYVCGANETDSADAVRAKIDEMMVGAPVEQTGRVRQMFEVLLAVERSGQGQQTGDNFKQELFSVVSDAIYHLASGNPTVMVFDDLHWADRASIEALQHLFQLTKRLPVLFLCAYRPDQQAPSAPLRDFASQHFADRYSEIALSPLSGSESATLVDSLLTIADLPGTMRELILAKAEGNPFFVEEIIRTLIESGVVVRDESGSRWRAAHQESAITVPDSVQALLMARVDRLDEATRHTLQLAAVLGRTFPYRLLSALSDAGADLNAQLGRLLQLDLIQVASDGTERAYSFRHSLTREAAYNSILLRQRREFHRRVGETLAALFADRLDDYAATLAQHFHDAEDPRAFSYHLRAGDNALRFYAIDEALLHYNHTIEVLPLTAPDDEQLGHLYLQRGRALELASQYSAAVANYVELEQLAVGRASRHLQLAGLMERAKVHATPNLEIDPALSRELAERALALARELGDHPAEARTHWLLLLALTRLGDLAAAQAHGEASLTLARRRNLREQIAYTLTNLADIVRFVGQLERIVPLRAEADQLWQELGNLPMRADNLVGLSFHHMLLGDQGQAISYAAQAQAISREAGNEWGQANSRMFLALAYLEPGHIAEAIVALEEGIALSEAAQHPAALIGTRSDLGYTYGFVGNMTHALSLLAEATSHAQGQLAVLRPLPLSLQALLYFQQGDVAAGEAALAQIENAPTMDSLFDEGWYSVAQMELALAQGKYKMTITISDVTTARLPTLGVNLLISDSLYAKARALIGLGQAAAAEQVLQQAQTAAKAVTSRRTLWQICALQSRLVAARGDLVAASELHQQAVAVINYITEHTPGELRASFLARPDVAAVREGAQLLPSDTQQVGMR